MNQTKEEKALKYAILDMPFANTIPIEWTDHEWSQLQSAFSERLKIRKDK